MSRFCCALALVAAVFFAADQTAIAQKTESAPQSENSKQQQKPQPSAAALPAIPDPYKLNMMIRSAIIALNQANKTGNYTVLQDLGAPAFRAANNSVRIAQIFAELRQRNLDLSPILFFTPQLIQKPQINPNGILRLTGYFPTSPERVNFDLYFQMVNDDWRIFGIGVRTSRVDVTSTIPPQGQNNPANKKPAAAGQAFQDDVPAQTATAPVDAPPPARKPQPSRRTAVGAPNEGRSSETSRAVQNGTINNATRIDLSKKRAQSWNVSEEEPSTATSETEAGLENKSSPWGSFNPFSW
jgi:hypothetical protein